MQRFYAITALYAATMAAALLIPQDALERSATAIPVTLAYLATLVWGAASIRSQMFVPAFCKGRKGTGKVALTFDDGPDPANSRQILDLLDQHGCRATFFLKGAMACRNEELVRRMWETGHSLGNHSFGHSVFFPLMAGKRIREEILETNRVISRITGGEVRYFRPPFGVTNPRIHRGLKGTGMQVAGWSIRSWDTRGEEPGRVAARILKRLKEGDIVLLHENAPHILEILEAILPRIREKGLQCSTLEQLN